MAMPMPVTTTWQCLLGLLFSPCSSASLSLAHSPCVCLSLGVSCSLSLSLSLPTSSIRTIWELTRNAWGLVCTVGSSWHTVGHTQPEESTRISPLVRDSSERSAGPLDSRRRAEPGQKPKEGLGLRSGMFGSHALARHLLGIFLFPAQEMALKSSLRSQPWEPWHHQSLTSLGRPLCQPRQGQERRYAGAQAGSWFYLGVPWAANPLPE